MGTVRYNWPMSALASQAFSIAHCTDSEDLPIPILGVPNPQICISLSRCRTAGPSRMFIMLPPTSLLTYLQKWRQVMLNGVDCQRMLGGSRYTMRCTGLPCLLSLIVSLTEVGTDLHFGGPVCTRNAVPQHVRNAQDSSKMLISGPVDLQTVQRVKCGWSLRIFSADLMGNMRMRIFS